MQWSWLLAAAGCGRLGFEPATTDGLDADDRLLLHLALDTIEGGATLDVTGTIAARCEGARCPSARVGRIGNALGFDGDELRIAWDQRFETPSALTIAAWYFGDASGGSIVARPTPVDIFNTWQLEIVGGDPAFTTSSASTHDKLRGSPVRTSAWTHLAGVWDGTTKTLYVDGVVAASRAWSDVRAASEPIVLGFDLNSGSPDLHLLGAIDDVRLYDRALSATEIASLAR